MVVPVTGVAFACRIMDQVICASLLPNPLFGMYDVGMLKVSEYAVPCRQYFCGVPQRHPEMTGEQDDGLVLWTLGVGLFISSC